MLIGVEYAPINMNDLYLIQGVYPVSLSLPSVVDNEGVGRVLAIGSGVDHLKVGDRVLVPLYSFSWRERLVAPGAGLSPLPEAEPRPLAMLGTNPPTAALLLNESVDLRPGDWVAPNAANPRSQPDRDPHWHRSGGPRDVPPLGRATGGRHRQDPRRRDRRSRANGADRHLPVARRGRPDLQYQVVVAVLRFDGRKGGDVTLDARWRILGRDGNELAFRRSTVIEAATGSGYQPMVAAMARALGSLGREIAAEIRTLPEGSRR